MQATLEMPKKSTSNNPNKGKKTQPLNNASRKLSECVSTPSDGYTNGPCAGNTFENQVPQCSGIERLAQQVNLSESEIRSILYSGTNSAGVQGIQNEDYMDVFSELPPFPSYHQMSPSPNQSRPHSPINQSQKPIEPLKRKRDDSTDGDGYTTVRNKNSHGQNAGPSMPTAAPTPTSNRYSPFHSLKPPPIILPQSQYDQSVVSNWLRNHTAVTDYKSNLLDQKLRFFTKDLATYQQILNAFQNPQSRVSYFLTSSLTSQLTT